MITWINCSERMPPDDENLYILKHKIHEDTYRLDEGWQANGLWFPNSWMWCPYTEEAWKELTKVQ